MAKNVCVIGAGLSGLAAIRGLREAGLQVTCFEAGPSIGGTWRYQNENGTSAAYRSLHTNVSRRIGIFDAGAGRLKIAEAQADWLGAVLAGRIALPGREEMWRAIDACGEPRTRQRFASSGAHTVLCDRHAYLSVLRGDLAAVRAGASSPVVDVARRARMFRCRPTVST